MSEIACDTCDTLQEILFSDEIRGWAEKFIG